MPKSWTPWETTVIEALTHLGGRAHLSVLYEQVARRRRKAKLKILSSNYTAKVRQILQYSERTAPVPNRRGYWRLVGRRGRPRRSRL